MRFQPILHLLIVFAYLPVTAFGQLAQPGTPDLLTRRGEKIQLATYSLQVPDVQQARQEDATKANPRFAIPIPVAINPLHTGQWQQLENGDWRWWLELQAKDAKGLAVFYQDFELPVGVKLFMLDGQRQEVFGAYTSWNNKPSKRFVTGFVGGEKAILELQVPKRYGQQAFFELFRVDYAYRDFRSPTEEKSMTFGFGSSNDCHVNMNCPEGADFQEEKEGVCRIRMTLEEGTGWCSGSLLNNTAEDGTPYVLSGFHCQDGYTPIYDLWRFDFDYLSETCQNPADEPSFLSIVGAVQRAGRQESDFLLVEITTPIPAFFGLRYNGWDRSAPAPAQAAHIHHPRADIQKFSIDTNSVSIHPSSINWNNGVTTPANHHLRTVLDVGTFEVGSSGGPLFNPAGQVVGQLHGGFEGCEQVTAYFGRLSISWDAGAQPSERLEEWLDPLGTGQMTLNGYEPPIPTTAFLSGKIQVPTGEKVAGVTVFLTGAVQASVQTDTSGQFLFEDLPLGAAYQVTFEKDYNADNGVTTLDMVQVQRHILGLSSTLNNPYRLLAADANNSGNVSTLDMVFMQRVILGLDDSFPNNGSWRFVPVAYTFPDPENPFSNPVPNAIVINALQQSLIGLDFYGLKVGDVNDTADPWE